MYPYFLFFGEHKRRFFRFFFISCRSKEIRFQNVKKSNKKNYLCTVESSERSGWKKNYVPQNILKCLQYSFATVAFLSTDFIYILHIFLLCFFILSLCVTFCYFLNNTRKTSKQMEIGICCCWYSAVGAALSLSGRVRNQEIETDWKKKPTAAAAATAWNMKIAQKHRLDMSLNFDSFRKRNGLHIFWPLRSYATREKYFAREKKTTRNENE